MERFSKYFSSIFFVFIQKPFYNANYNHDNKFSCHGLLINSSIELVGKDNTIIIKGGLFLKM